MNTQIGKLEKIAELQSLTEEIAGENAPRFSVDITALSVEEMRRILHRLRVHQIELEIQNEELRRVQAELDASRARYRDLYDHAPVGYVTLSDNGLILEANITFANLLGIERGALIKQPITRFIHKEDQEVYYLYSKQLHVAGTQQEYGLRMVKKGGLIFWAFLTATIIRDTEGTPVSSVVMSDITERKRTWEAFRQGEDRHHAILQTAMDGFWRADISGRLLEVNETYCRMSGYSVQELLTMRIVDLESIEVAETTAARIRKIIEEGSDRFETRHRRKNGSIFHVEVSVQHQPIDGELVVFLRDITDRNRAQEALLESVARLKAVFNATSDSVMLIKPDGKILDLNKTTADRYGVDMETMLGKNIFDYLAAEGASLRRSAISKILNERRSIQSDERRLCQYEELRSGKYYSIRLFPVLDESGNVVQFASFSRDITERKQLEQKLQQSQRIEAIGALSGGIAHDFNNILFPIIGISEMLMEELPADSQERQYIDIIFKSARRAGDLVKQILSFSRQVDHEKLPVRIQQILKEALKLTRSTIPSNIDITHAIQNDCGLVMADPTQVHQIAMNLITNAYHAVDEAGGTIFVALKELILSSKDLAASSLKPGKYAVLTVSDTGHGIDPFIIGKIFEPFFTTKGVGKGTGLGLSVVHGIVKAHDGDIHVSSEVGRGATFTVYLPVCKDAANAIAHENVIIHETGTESVLLVDDEEPIVHLEQLMLEKLGYHVTAYTDSLEALSAFRAGPEAFDLVMTDMTMPNMTGDQLARELGLAKPGIPVIICTGFSSKINEDRAKEMGIKGFLLKPIIKSEMAKVIRDVLNEAIG